MKPGRCWAGAAGEGDQCGTGLLAYLAGGAGLCPQVPLPRSMMPAYSYALPVEEVDVAAGATARLPLRNRSAWRISNPAVSGGDQRGRDWVPPRLLVASSLRFHRLVPGRWRDRLLASAPVTTGGDSLSSLLALLARPTAPEVPLREATMRAGWSSSGFAPPLRRCGDDVGAVGDTRLTFAGGLTRSPLSPSRRARDPPVWRGLSSDQTTARPALPAGSRRRCWRPWVSAEAFFARGNRRGSKSRRC